MSYCCTVPLPPGTGNFTNNPLFINGAAGNFHLKGASPCVNSGSNTSTPPGPDLDGNPRIFFGTVDLGAYELQPPTAPVLTTQLRNTDLAIRWIGLSGLTYQPFSSSNLVNWDPYGPPLQGSNSVLELLVPAVVQPLKFVQVRAEN
jgi:hypothetical protein